MRIDFREQDTSYIDFNEIIAEFSQDYDVVHHTQICKQDFIYRVLGRKEFNKILSLNLSDMEKEDEICKTCLLYPKDYDFDECEAGIPTILSETILENSFLDGIDSTLRLIYHFQDEMDTIEHQMYCIISEAFPSYTLEEIESWSNIRFCKMFTRAKWILSNLRGLELNDVAEYLETISDLQDDGMTIDEINEHMNNSVKAEEEKADTRKRQRPNETTFTSTQQQVDNSSNPNISKNGKEKLTPEKLRELEEMKRKFPEINWGGDEILTRGADNVMQNMDPMSTVSPALRPGWGR